MANTILITANWHTGALSQQTISMQYDNNRYVVQFVGYPEASDGNELDYYLLVWMSSAPGEKPDEIAPIQLASDQWYISNVFTQQTQQIKFQMCALNTEGTFEAHSPIFSGRIGDSLEHDGTSHDIDVSTLFDAYREYLNELIIRAGAVVIDPTLSQSGQAADAKAVGDNISTVLTQIPIIDAVPTQGSTNAVSSGGVWDDITGLKAEISALPVYFYAGEIAQTGNGFISNAGVITAHNNYKYAKYNLHDGTQKITVDSMYITGSASNYAVFAFFDSSDTLVSTVNNRTINNTNTGNTFTNVDVNVPLNADYVLVTFGNMSSSTTFSSITEIGLYKPKTNKRVFNNGLNSSNKQFFYFHTTASELGDYTSLAFNAKFKTKSPVLSYEVYFTGYDADYTNRTFAIYKTGLTKGVDGNTVTIAENFQDTSKSLSSKTYIGVVVNFLYAYSSETGARTGISNANLYAVTSEYCMLNNIELELAHYPASGFTTLSAEFSEHYNPLYGGFLCAIGDSLTGVYYKAESETWVALIAKWNNMQYENHGVSGNPMAKPDGYTSKCMAERVDDLSATKYYSHIFVMGGANDYNERIPIGKNTDTEIATFKGAINHIIATLTQKFPNARIVFATTYRRNQAYADKPYADAMMEVCRLHSIPCLNNYENSGVQFFDENWMAVYGATNALGNNHLNAAGDLFVAPKFEHALKYGVAGNGCLIDPAPTQGGTNAVSSGGVYEALQNIDVSTDTTLRISGKPADAKAVGDAIADKAISAQAYDATLTYSVGDYCLKDDVIYRCIEPIVTPEAWNAEHWTAISGNDVIEDINDKLDLLVEYRAVESEEEEQADIIQLLDPESITWSLVGSTYRGYVGLIPIFNDGAYYPNPYAETSSDKYYQLSYAHLYDANGNELTITDASSGSAVSYFNIFGTYGSRFTIENHRTLKIYARGNTLSKTYTTDGDIAYIGRDNKTSCFFASVPSADTMLGITFGGYSTSYVAYDGGEHETSYELTYATAFEAYIRGLISDSTITVDDTLSNSGDAADALAVGNKFASIVENTVNLIDESKFDFTSTSYWTLETGYYFPVTAGKKICTSVAKPRFYFYDANKTELSSASVVNTYALVDIPSGAVWARMIINASANTLSEIQGKIMVYESDATSNDDRRDYVPPTKIIGNLVDGDIYGTAKPLSLDIDILTASQYRAVRALNHQRNAFRIGTFNIYVTRTQYHWGALKQELKDYSIDICAMQEVSNSIDRERYVQNFLTMNTWQFKYGSQAVFNDTASDKAVVSAYEIVSTELFTNSTGRTYTKTVINLPQYKRNAHQFTLSVYSAHLNLTASNRLVEASEILATVAQDTSDFIVICMDSNTFKSEADAQGKLPTWEAFISAGFTPIHYGEYSTVTDMTDTDTSIDQIFMGQNITCADYDIVNSNDYLVPIRGQNLPISDHCMVYADLIFDFDALL